MSEAAQTDVLGTLGYGVLQGFTATAVPGGPISVVPKQTVQVTVVISFS
jgi:hypothetical protein